MKAIAILALLVPSWSAAAGGDAAFTASVGAALAPALASAQALRAMVDEDDLVDLLGDRDPEVRTAALKTAREAVGFHTRVRERVLDLARDRSEDAGVRREAARTLYYAANLTEPREALQDLAAGSGPAEVREMAYKALYLSCQTLDSVRERILDAARREPEAGVRRAAVWALFGSTGDPDVVDALRGMAGSAREPAELRAEALKSLYLGMNRSEVREDMLELAKDGRAPLAVRETAVYALGAARWDGGVTRYLEELSRASGPLRVAAIKALSGDERFFHLYFHIGLRTSPHHYVSPIEFE